MVCRALKELGLAGRRNEVIAAEVRALKDDDALVREIALESLAELGPESVAAFAAIEDLLRRDRSSQVRVTAAHVLAQLDPSGKLSVPLLAAMLRDPDFGLRISLLRDLKTFGPKGEAATPYLIEVIEQDESSQPSSPVKTLQSVISRSDSPCPGSAQHQFPSRSCSKHFGANKTEKICYVVQRRSFRRWERSVPRPCPPSPLLA